MDFFISLFSDPVGFWNSHSLLISQIGINSMIATSMFLVLYSGQLSLAAPGFMAIGAYTSVLMDLNWHTPLVLNIAVGVVLAGVMGALSACRCCGCAGCSSPSRPSVSSRRYDSA